MQGWNGGSPPDTTYTLCCTHSCAMNSRSLLENTFPAVGATSALVKQRPFVDPGAAGTAGKRYQLQGVLATPSLEECTATPRSPVGLCGLFKSSIFVFGVNAAASASRLVSSKAARAGQASTNCSKVMRSCSHNIHPIPPIDICIVSMTSLQSPHLHLMSQVSGSSGTSLGTPPARRHMGPYASYIGSSSTTCRTQRLQGLG